jgi:hypothetical protein
MVFYDRQGHPIDETEFVRLFGDPAYKRVACTSVCPGLAVSTVWTGIWPGAGPPTLFETKIFVNWKGTETYRYATEAEAIAHHDQLVAELRAQVNLDQEEKS